MSTTSNSRSVRPRDSHFRNRLLFYRIITCKALANMGPHSSGGRLRKSFLPSRAFARRRRTREITRPRDHTQSSTHPVTTNAESVPQHSSVHLQYDLRPRHILGDLHTHPPNPPHLFMRLSPRAATRPCVANTRPRGFACASPARAFSSLHRTGYPCFLPALLLSVGREDAR